MTKKVVIVISLVEESVEKANEEIEKDILEELSEDLPRIPWFKSAEKVTVMNDQKEITERQTFS